VWLRELLALRKSRVGSTEKVKRVAEITLRSGSIKHLSVLLAAELKRVGWDERSWPSRLALAGVLVAIVPFWGEGAGIAAFGSAIGVPLWVVFGAGGAFAGVLLQELRGTLKP
jgi:hypothetical protein